MNLNVALSALPQTDITLLARTEGEWEKGRFEEGREYNGETFRGVVQPFPEKKLRQFPAGEQAFGAKLIHTKRPLQTTDEESQTPADHVSIGGSRYKIVAWGDWSLYGFNRYVGVLAP